MTGREGYGRALFVIPREVRMDVRDLVGVGLFGFVCVLWAMGVPRRVWRRVGVWWERKQWAEKIAQAHGWHR